jgi:DNA adenine methylase
MLPALLGAAPKEFDRYVEPFAGSACLFFALRPTNAVLGDINRQLLQTYETVRDHPLAVARRAKAFPDNEDEYYRLRDEVKPSKNVIENAARFIYLNRHCFNGVYRTNKSGHFNVPRGRNTGRIQDERFFLYCSRLFKNVDFRPGDFSESLVDISAGDFVYLDPPYIKAGRKPSGEYGYGSFAEIDLDRLYTELERLDDIGAKFLLSYASELANIKSKWHKFQTKVHRSVAGFAEKRSEVTEILVSNYSITLELDE